MRCFSPLWPICLWTIGLFAFWPLRNAGFLGDDWHFFALFRHVDSLSALVTIDAGGSYIFRPIAFLFSALTFVAFDLDHRWHFTINVALHAGACLASAQLLATTTARPKILWRFGALMFTLPIVAVIPTWTANRFDLLATLATLCALNAALRSNYSLSVLHAVVALAWLIVAIGSKETGYVAALGMCLIWLMQWRGQFRWIIAVLVIVVLSLAARYAALGGFLADWVASDPNTKLIPGILAQIAALAYAIKAAAPYVAAAAFVYVAQWFVGRVESSERATAARLRSSFRFYSGSPHVVALILLLLAITTLVLQAPVGGLLFSGEPARANGTGLRFFYLPIFLTFVAAWSVIPLSPKARSPDLGLYVLALATTLAACLFAWKTQNTNAQIAREATLVRADVSQLVTRFMQVAGSRDLKEDRCVIFGESLAQNIRETSLDLVIKAHLPANDPHANCLLITDPPQYLSLTRVRPCSNSYLEPDLKSAYSRQPLYRLGTCTFLGPTAK